MPKISNKSVKVNSKTGWRSFDFQIMYNQDLKFYAILPKEFDIQFDHMSDKELKDHFAKKIYKRGGGYTGDKNYTRIVSDGTEEDCIKRMDKILTFLINKVVEVRRVIIVFYNGEYNCQYGDMVHNDEHEQIGMRFGLSYCEESAIGGKEKIYQIVTKRKKNQWDDDADGEYIEERKKMSVWREDCTIIDDTPENREFLEALYKTFFALNEQLTKFTKTPAALLTLINSKQKLIQ